MITISKAIVKGWDLKFFPSCYKWHGVSNIKAAIGMLVVFLWGVNIADFGLIKGVWDGKLLLKIICPFRYYFVLCIK